uniref:dual-specificity kinase n=1 Tax=Ganoderma boninense TaxID=34458 RepID=A0A5K1JTV4_9APHY|nr:Protein kinase domain-containing protein [Ganoderma boninense]
MVPQARRRTRTSLVDTRSLGGGAPPQQATSKEKVKDRRRDTLSLSIRHSRQGSSSSSHGESHHPRRVHNSDFSHLPPSPSTSSIQQFLGRAGTAGSSTSSPLHSQPHVASNVAHSLLRGTQEGWSDLDDQTTLEALRKLDGLSGKTARARSSIGGHSRVGSSSRPGTPAKATTQWEGIESGGNRSSKRTSVHASLSGKDKDKGREVAHRSISGPIPSTTEGSADTDYVVTSGDDIHHDSPQPDRGTKKTGTTSARSSFTPKRGSASSGTYASTPTTSSRDSASLSVGTSNTSVSAVSGRQSSGKAKRNSTSSDISIGHLSDPTTVRDRAASLVAPADTPEESYVPPVPPLPKELSSFKATLSTPGASHAPIVEYHSDVPISDRSRRETFNDVAFPSTLDVPVVPTTPSKHSSLQVPKSTTPTNMHKTPSKKWSFSGALGRKLSSTPSTSSMKDAAKSSAASATSPRVMSFGQQLRKSMSKEKPLSPGSKVSEDWSPINSDAMASATSLASLSSLGSGRAALSPSSGIPPTLAASKTPDRLVSSRTGTASSGASTHVPPIPQNVPLSPSSSMRRNPSTKRLTPSSIPFFRRSSSQSMQVPPPSLPTHSVSPTLSSGPASGTHLRAPTTMSPTKDSNLSSPTVPGSAKKSRSLHSDKEKDVKSSRESAATSSDREKSKKEDKDRSESRISVLMGRKRGKTLSSAQQPPKKTEPVALPPMQIAALPASTAQRVANLKSSQPSSSASANTNVSPVKAGSSRATSQTVSSMQKQSDTSLRRHQLPTIAGSPSVTGNTQAVVREAKEGPPLSSLNLSTILSKETPTKIPRISSRSSAVNSPTLKANGTSRRASMIIGSSSGITSSRAASPTAGSESMNEFGVLENGQVSASKTARNSVRASPQTTSSRVPRQVSASNSTANGSTIPRKNRESLSFGLRKASTGSVASTTSGAHDQPQQSAHSHHRFSALSPSKGLKLLSPKVSLPSARSSNNSTPSIHQTMGTPTGSRQSLSTPSPVPSSVDEEELLGDEEMMQYIKRQQAKKLQSGSTQEDLDAMLRFPEPIPPAPALSPQAVLKSDQARWLCEYECKEILDYESVYYVGAHSEKKMATPDNSTNNYGYDDERGDYQVINHDHLAYRYEIIDTLGKGSFGQVLHCRDHGTGESMAIKIIRNKKRFHHQALVEIKILDSLRKWDAEEKHHVIKMTEHFYFRGHLCIAMELLSINLYELIKANNFHGFTTALIRRFTSQMLQSLLLMRQHRIVHCDLKPENVLLRHPAKSAIKVIDFGSSCFEHEKIYTYIQSRFYRSPEVILGMNYHMAIDMWSLGCIMAELYTGFPIFPGENEQEQLACIMEVLGAPEKDFINRSSRKRLFFDTTGAPRPVVNSKGKRRRPGTKTLAQALKNPSDEQFVDFITKCLMWDPERRLKPQAALRHPYITGGRRSKVPNPTPSSTAKTFLQSASSNLGSRSTKVTETPKKSLISAPTPLTARTSRTLTVPSTPSGSTTIHVLISFQPYDDHKMTSMKGYLLLDSF